MIKPHDDTWRIKLYPQYYIDINNKKLNNTIKECKIFISIINKIMIRPEPIT